MTSSRPFLKLGAREVGPEELDALIEGEVSAIWVPALIPGALAARIHEALLSRTDQTRQWKIGSNPTRENVDPSSFERFGVPLNEAIAKDNGEVDSLQGYFEETHDRIEVVLRRELDICPVQLLRGWMSEASRLAVEPRHFDATPYHAPEADMARLRRWQGRELRAMIARFLRPGSVVGSIGIHTDYEGASDFNDHADFLLSANLYCGVPERGGELLVWPQVRSHHISVIYEHLEETAGIRCFGDATADDAVAALDIPHFEIRPGPGDLVLLNTGHGHGVRGSSSGELRTSLQTFFDRARGAEALRMWT